MKRDTVRGESALAVGGRRRVRPPARDNGQAALPQLRGEAAALHERAEYLQGAAARLEAQLVQLLGSSGGTVTPRIRRVQRVAQDTVALLEETIRRRGEVRAWILEEERRAEAHGRVADTAAETTRGRAIQAARAAAPALIPQQMEPHVGAALEPVRPAAPAAPTEAAPDIEALAPQVEAVPAEKASFPAQSAAAPVPAPSAAGAEKAEVEEPATRAERAEPRIRRQQLQPLADGTVGRLVRRAVRVLAAVVMAAAVIVLALLLTPLPELFDVQLFAVLSGSMAPTIPVGSVIVVQPVGGDALRVGDVITFSDRVRPELRVTHRIVELQNKGGQRVAITKGDANNTTDSWDVPTTGLVGRVVAHVPYGGYLMAWLVSPLVKLLALTLAALLMFVPSLPIFNRRRGRALRDSAPARQGPHGPAITAPRPAPQPAAPAAPEASGPIEKPVPASRALEAPRDETFDALAREIEALLGDEPATARGQPS